MSRTTARLIPALVLSGTAATAPDAAFAACDLAAPAGTHRFVCDSGQSVGGLAVLDGSNRLALPAGGTGIIVGDVVFGPGADRIGMDSGAISGRVDEGGGADGFAITAGRVTGNVQQGAGIDDFRMHGGEIGSLSQGDNLDRFFLFAGRIVDSFEDGDQAVMTGGRIGRVNMKLDDNLFDMSGGTIDGNLVTGFGNDTIRLSAGTIGGNVSVSGGTDAVAISGGTVGGEIRMSVGADTLSWSGGVVYGLVDLGGDDDVATFANLTDANLGATPAITGGAGTDRLHLDNVKTTGVARFDRWERIALANDSELVFDGTLRLGDETTGGGTLSLDATSTLFGGGGRAGGVAGFAGGAATVINAGRIDLTDGGATGDRFTIAGNYIGEGGQLLVDTELGDDTAPSDRLVIDGGTASGSTGIGVVATGSGGETVGNGIMLVEAANGGATEAGAFALGNRVAAGAFEYYLFRGGIAAGTDSNWYLRSTLVTPAAAVAPPDPAPAPAPLDPPPPEPEPEAPNVAPPPPPSTLPDPPPLPTEGGPATPPVDPTPPVLATDPEPQAPPPPPPAPPPDPPLPPPPPSTNPAPVPQPEPRQPPTPGARPVEAAVVPLYRVEVPTYSVIPPVAHELALASLGTFHERRGEQALLASGGTLPASWVRVLAQRTDQSWSGTVDPGIDGDLTGIEVGLDLLGGDAGDGHFDRAGVFLAYASIDAQVSGQALGWSDLAVGDVDADGTSLGAYWTHVGPGGWYLDGVLMATWYGGDATAKSGESVDVDGTGFTASIEGGYPLAVSDRWRVEPQAQLVWNHLALDDQRDDFSEVGFDTDDAVTGRLGLRAYPSAPMGKVEPYLKLNLWQDFSADDTVDFGGDAIVTELDGTALEVGGGLVARLNEAISLFATADYTTNLGGQSAETIQGNLGLAIRF